MKKDRSNQMPTDIPHISPFCPSLWVSNIIPLFSRFAYDDRREENICNLSADEICTFRRVLSTLVKSKQLDQARILFAVH